MANAKAPVFSDPEKELGGRRPDQVEELNLAGKNIDRLRGFEKFVNLRDLFLGENRIQRVLSLESCRRLTTLHLQSNVINTITGAFKHQPCLEVLLLHHNQLRGLDEVVEELRHLKYLHTLTLFGNVLEQESNYRPYTVHHMPSLLVFDRRNVTSRLRESARRFFAAIDPHYQKRRRSLPPTRSVLSASTRSAGRGLRQELLAEATKIGQDRELRETAALEAMFHNEVSPTTPSAVPPLPRSLDFLAARRAAAQSEPPPPEPKSRLTPFMYTILRWQPDTSPPKAVAHIPTERVRERTRALGTYGRRAKSAPRFRLQREDVCVG